MIVFSGGSIDPLPFTYTATTLQCPDCETALTLVDRSTMLTCSEGHGPFFLV